MLCYCGSYILSVGECIIQSGVYVSHSEWADVWGDESFQLCVWEGESFKVFMRGGESFKGSVFECVGGCV